MQELDSPGTVLISTLFDILALDILALDILEVDILGMNQNLQPMWSRWLSPGDPTMGP